MSKSRWGASARAFKPIDRSVSSVDRDFGILDRADNVKIDPAGRIVLRDGYALSSDYNTSHPNWFEFTTPFAQRLIRNDAVTANTNVYQSVRRKCLVELEESGVRYLFTGWVEVKNLSMRLYLYRGTIAADGSVTWSAGITDALLTDDSGTFKYLAADTAYDQKWLEFSMVASADGKHLYIAEVLRDDDGVQNISTLRVIDVSNLFDDVWGASTTFDKVELLAAGDDEIVVSGADAITHDLDICLDDVLGGLHVGYGYYNAVSGKRELKFLKAGSTHYVGSGIYTAAVAATDLYGLTMVYNPTDTRVYVTYIRDAISDTVALNNWLANAFPTFTTVSLLTTGFQVESGNARFASSLGIAVDSAGTLHFVYRSDADTLSYVTRTPTAISTPVALYDIDTGYSGTPNDVLVDYLTNWDFVVRNNKAFVYFVKAADDYKIRMGTNLSGTWDTSPALVHVSQQTNTKHVSYLMCDRSFRETASRRMVFIDTDVTSMGATTCDYMYLHQEKDADEGDLLIEAMHEYSAPQTDGTTTKTLVVQCSDSRFYKRISTSLHWEMLENTMDVDNAAESWWKRLDAALADGGIESGGFSMTTPDPTPHAHFIDHKGNLRAGLGIGQGIVPIHYGLINRKFFDNSGTYDYADHFLDVSMIQSPKGVITPANGDVMGIGQYAYNEGAGWIVSNNIPNAPFHLQPFVGEEASSYYKKYRPFVLSSNNHPSNGLQPSVSSMEAEIDKDFSPVFDFEEDDKRAKFSAFYVGVSFVYDGFQESQILVWEGDIRSDIGGANLNIVRMLSRTRFAKHKIAIPTDPTLNAYTPCVLVGYAHDRDDSEIFMTSYIGMRLRLPTWNTSGTPRLNPRITAVRIWLAELKSGLETPADLQFFPVKDVIVSKKEAFKDEWWNGEREWVWNSASSRFRPEDGSHADLPIIIDLNDWIEANKLGNYKQINGHSDDLFDATYGLHRSAFPEAYKASIVVGDKMLVGGVRIDGVDRPNRIIISATRVELDQGYDTPDVLPDQQSIDFPFNFKRFGKLDDRTAVIVGDSGIAIYDTVANVLRHSLTRLGTDADDSVVNSVLGRDGVVLMSGNRFKFWAGFGEPMNFSEAIGNSSQDGIALGLDDLDDSDVWVFTLPQASQQLIAFVRTTPYLADDIYIFIYDPAFKGWYQAQFGHAFKCGCNSLDGNLLFSEGTRIYAFPSGNTDAGTGITPTVQLSDVAVPSGAEVDLEYMFATTKCDKDITATIIRDNASISSLNQTITGTSVTNEVMRQPAVSGRKIKRSATLKLTATTPTTFEVESLSIEGLPLRRIQ